MSRISAGFVVAVLGLVMAVAPASGATRATLRVAGTEPLAVRGVAFRPGERVSLTAMTLLGQKRTVVRASHLGRFAATFRLPTQPCGSAFTLRAVGALGSQATLRLSSGPCVPPPIR